MRDGTRSRKLRLLDLSFAKRPWLPVRECFDSRATTGAVYGGKT